MSEIGVNFSDISSYNEQMSKAMADKLYFLNHLPADEYLFVNFGCANGALINALTHYFSKQHKVRQHFIGYDISEEMIKLAKASFTGDQDVDVSFCNKWSDVSAKMKWYRQYYKNIKQVLVLSSVIHEVYSYANTYGDIQSFWDNVLYSDFDYIVIRDMCPSKDIERETTDDMFQKVVSVYAKQLQSFTEKWGPITNNKNLVHYLLKYRWKINWEREVNENYFPIYVEELLEKMNANEKYNMIYFKHFRVPFLDECIYKDYRIALTDYTHVKAIFKKRAI